MDHLGDIKGKNTKDAEGLNRDEQQNQEDK